MRKGLSPIADLRLLSFVEVPDDPTALEVCYRGERRCTIDRADKDLISGGDYFPRLELRAILGEEAWTSLYNGTAPLYVDFDVTNYRRSNIRIVSAEECEEAWAQFKLEKRREYMREYQRRKYGFKPREKKENLTPEEEREKRREYMREYMRKYRKENNNG